MHIAGITAEYVRAPLGSEFRPTWNTGVVQDAITMVLVHIESDDGICGIGAGPCSGPPAAQLIEDQFKRLLIGIDPFRIEEISRLTRPVADEYAWPWCVEMAIWDLVGKATGQPVYKLLGGFNDALPAYASLGERRDAETRLSDISRLKSEGFRAVKLRFRGDTVQEDIATLHAIRDAHPNLTIMVDANQGNSMPGSQRIYVWDLKTALYVADALVELDVAWLEEPLPRRHYRELAELTRMARLPIAGGELNLRMDEFTILIERRCYDIIQADAAFSEGIWGCRKIAAVAEAFGLPFIPHTWSNGIGMMANAHLAASLPNCNWLEIPYDPPAFTHQGRDALLNSSLTVDEDGMVALPNTPGLGIDLDRGLLAHLRMAQQ
ncbi:MAG: mandelate racemase/muconate lactonizing enzyme family protein [Chloroflexota bacterium]|nr:mandelate racemase/muconate lactonizing enzyme family protein [Chloroflexota bacterium]